MKLLYSIHKCDVFMFTWLINTRMRSTLITSSRRISKTGDGQLYVLLTGLLYLIYGFCPLVQAILLAFLIERPVYFILKNSLKRNRPQAALEDYISIIVPSDKFSFPSGHTSAAFMIATLIGGHSPALLAIFYCWAFSVGVSRVVLGVHFPTDTLVGCAMGICAALVSLNYFNIVSVYIF